jgi:hypothetical protein
MKHLFDGLTDAQRTELEAIVEQLGDFHATVDGLFDPAALEGAQSKELTLFIQASEGIDEARDALNRLLHPTKAAREEAEQAAASKKWAKENPEAAEALGKAFDALLSKNLSR